MIKRLAYIISTLVIIISIILVVYYANIRFTQYEKNKHKMVNDYETKISDLKQQILIYNYKSVTLEYKLNELGIDISSKTVKKDYNCTAKLYLYVVKILESQSKEENETAIVVLKDEKSEPFILNIPTKSSESLKIGDKYLFTLGDNLILTDSAINNDQEYILYSLNVSEISNDGNEENLTCIIR